MLGKMVEHTIKDFELHLLVITAIGNNGIDDSEDALRVLNFLPHFLAAVDIVAEGVWV